MKPHQVFKLAGFGRLTAIFISVLIVFSIMPASASAQTRSLKLYYLHTGERATITYKRGGRYLPDGLKKVNWFLRDWRRNEPTKMDPQLLDLLWEVYRKSGSRKAIHIISGYRSPASNEMLRKRGRGVAKNSQHTRGKAMDFYLPDVKLSKLRAIGLKMGVGGVGYYPTSGSPFVHLDTGRVRHWPRMSRKELVRVFPNGKTLHVPTDGKPLKGYDQAMANYKRRKATGKLVPSSGRGDTLVASLPKKRIKPAKPTRAVAKAVKKPTKAPKKAKPAVKTAAKPDNSGNLPKQGQFLLERLAALTRQDEAEDRSNNTAPAPRPVATLAAPVKTKPQTPAAQEPQEPTTGADFVLSPDAIPIPVSAPREDTATGTLIALADDGSVPSPDKIPESAEAVPAWREEETPATSELALAPVTALAIAPATAKIDRDFGLRVAALTPEEIEDLRSRAIAKSAENSSTVENNAAPQPAAKIPVAEPAPKPREIAEATKTRETITDINTETAKSDDDIGGPVTQVATTAAIPSARPTDEAEITAAERDDSANTMMANLPVPTPSPRAESQPVMAASVDIDDLVRRTPSTGELTAGLRERTISLDDLSAPQINSSAIGRYALAADTSIRDLADVRAPAYGRNMIRDVAKTFVLRGFETPKLAPGKNVFAGRAVPNPDYASITN